MTAPDLSRCSTLEILVGMFEHETAEDASHTWPQPVVRLVGRFLGDWRKRNPGRVIVCTRTMVAQRQCLITIYHSASHALPDAGGEASAPSGLPRHAANPAAPPNFCDACGG